MQGVTVDERAARSFEVGQVNSINKLCFTTCTDNSMLYCLKAKLLAI